MTFTSKSLVINCTNTIADYKTGILVIILFMVAVALHSILLFVLIFMLLFSFLTLSELTFFSYSCTSPPLVLTLRRNIISIMPQHSPLAGWQDLESFRSPLVVSLYRINQFSSCTGLQQCVILVCVFWASYMEASMY